MLSAVVSRKFIDPELVRKHLKYSPKTGQIKLKIATERLPAGHVFSSKYEDTYIKVYVDGEQFSAHRVAWVYMTGEQPDVIDHINGLRHDNRWCNLRDVDYSQNALNQRRYRRWKSLT